MRHGIQVGLLAGTILLATLAGVTTPRTKPSKDARSTTSTSTEPIPVRPAVSPMPASTQAATGRAKASEPASRAHVSDATAPSSHPAAPAPGLAGMVVAIDPETGLYGMPRIESDQPLGVEQLQDLARQETSGLVTVRHPDGSESLDHEGRFMEYVVIRMGPDGKAVFDCVEGEAAVRGALRKGRPIVAP